MTEEQYNTLRKEISDYSNRFDDNAKYHLSQLVHQLGEHHKLMVGEQAKLLREMQEIKGSLVGRRTETWALIAGTLAVLAVVGTLMVAVLDMHRSIVSTMSREAPAPPAPAAAAPPAAPAVQE